MSAPGNGRGRLALATSLMILAALCLTTVALLWAAQLWLPRSNLPEGYMVQLCATWRLKSIDNIQIAVSWMSPSVSSLPQKVFITRRYSCGFLPWSPSLPPMGGHLFMP